MVAVLCFLCAEFLLSLSMESLFQIGLDTNYWTAVNHFFIVGSLAMYFAILFAMNSDGIFRIFPNQFPFVGECNTTPLLLPTRVT